MEDQTPQFDDPALKTAIRAAFGSDFVPPHLRERIEGALAAASAPLPLWRRGNFQFFASAAAVILIGLGVGMYVQWQAREKTVPTWFADAMIATHDQCKALSDHHLLANENDGDLVGLRQQLRDTLGHPALVAMLGNGWKFKGAGICQVGKIPAAHLMFSRGDETVSIFSITEKLLYGNVPADGSTYAQTQQNHQIAGFIFGGAIHCLVGDSRSKRLTLNEIVQLRDAVRASPAGVGSQVIPLRVAH